MKIGIFGGSFNPPHKKHIEIIKTLIENKHLDKVIFVPTGTKYEYKNNLLPNNIRLDMLKLICNKENNFEVSDFELQDKVVYTYQTLDYFKNKYKDDEIYFICGSDNLSYIDEWKQGKYLLENYKFLITERDTNNIKSILNKYKEYISNIKVIRTNKDTISSTYIRNKIKDNKLEDVKEYLDKDVYLYIKKNNLYK